jgi:hypothetical protein
MGSEARTILNILIPAIGDMVFIAPSLFAWFKGAPAERYGAALYMASIILGGIFPAMVFGYDLPTLAELGLDALVAAGFLWLAIRYNSLWLGAAMMIKGVQLGLHAMHLTDMTDPRSFHGANLYLLALDVVSLMISLTIFFAALASIRARRKARASRPATAPALTGAGSGLVPTR